MKDIFDMDPELEGDEEPESPVKIPSKAEEAEDETLPFIPNLDKNNTAGTELNTPPKSKSPWDPTAPVDPDEAKSLMQKINAISGQPVSSSKGKPTLKVSKSVLKQALDILKSSEPWLPEGKKQVATQLDKVGKTIANALESYVTHLERME